jgi:hypothetical protein
VAAVDHGNPGPRRLLFAEPTDESMLDHHALLPRSKSTEVPPIEELVRADAERPFIGPPKSSGAGQVFPRSTS